MADHAWRPYGPDQAFGQRAASDERLLDEVLAHLEEQRGAVPRAANKAQPQGDLTASLIEAARVWGDASLPPATIAEVVDHPPVGPPAALAAAFRPPEPDHGRELRPVDGVEEAMLGPDRHGAALCHSA